MDVAPSPGPPPSAAVPINDDIGNRRMWHRPPCPQRSGRAVQDLMPTHARGVGTRGNDVTKGRFRRDAEEMQRRAAYERHVLRGSTFDRLLGTRPRGSYHAIRGPMLAH